MPAVVHATIKYFFIKDSPQEVGAVVASQVMQRLREVGFSFISRH